MQENGFFNTVITNLSLCIDKNDADVRVWGNSEAGFLTDRFRLISMPQFHEIWAQLPNIIKVDGMTKIKGLLLGAAHYEFEFMVEDENDNTTESAALLWLKLKKEGLI